MVKVSTLQLLESPVVKDSKEKGSNLFRGVKQLGNILSRGFLNFTFD